jgi:hypothetical protein
MSSDSPPSPTHATALLQRIPAGALLLGIGILVQTPVVLLVANNPARAIPPGDPPGYLQLAQNFLAHGVLSSFMTPPYVPEIFRTPGYPVFLACLLALGGGSLAVVAAAQSVLRILGGVLLESMAGDLLHARGWGAAAGVLWIMAPIPALYAGVIAPETLFAFLFLLSLYAMRHGGLRMAAFSGFVTGIAILVRPIGVILLFVLLPAVWSGRGKSFMRVASFLCAAGLALVPWLARNELVFGRLALSSVGGNNLLQYNAASCLGRRTGGGWESGAALAWTRYNDYLSQHHLRPASPVEESDAMGTVALQIILESPLECAAVGLADGWNTLRPGASYAMLFLRPYFLVGSGEGTEYSPALANLSDPWVLAVSLYLTLWYIGLYLAAAIGICGVVVRRQWRVFWMWILPMALLLLAPGTAGNARFRIPVDPGLSLLAVTGVAWVAWGIRRSDWGLERAADD